MVNDSKVQNEKYNEREIKPLFYQPIFKIKKYNI